MPRNGSGVYSLPTNSWNPAVSGTDIEPADWNESATDLEAGLTQSIAANGVTTITANLPMSGYKHTGVGVASARTQYGVVSQIQDNAYNYAAASGTDTYTATLAPAITGYVTGGSYKIKFANANLTTTPSLDLNSVGPKTIVRHDGTAVAAGDIAAGGVYDLTYDGTNMQLSSPSGAAAPVNASYVVIALNGSLTAERVLAVGSSLSIADGGAGGNATLTVAASGIITSKIAANAVTFAKLDANIFADASVVTPTTSDHVIIADASDGDETKRALVSGIVTLAAPAKFTSSALATTINASHTKAHGLGQMPFGVSVVYQCTSADLNYSVGDRVVMTGTPNAGGNNRNNTVSYDATNITLTIGTDTTTILDKTSRALGSIDTTKWSAYLQAWV